MDRLIAKLSRAKERLLQQLADANADERESLAFEANILHPCGRTIRRSPCNPARMAPRYMANRARWISR